MIDSSTGWFKLMLGDKGSEAIADASVKMSPELLSTGLMSFIFCTIRVLERRFRVVLLAERQHENE